MAAVSPDRVFARTREFRRADVGRVLLTAAAAVLWSLGWLAGMVVTAVVWSVAAISLGWRDARPVRSRTPGEPRMRVVA